MPAVSLTCSPVLQCPSDSAMESPSPPEAYIRYFPLVPLLCPGLCGSVWGQRAETLDSPRASSPMRPFPRRAEKKGSSTTTPDQVSAAPLLSLLLIHRLDGWLGVGGVPRQAYRSSSWFALQMHRRRAAAHADADADADGLYSPPLPPVTSARRAVGCRPAKERHWIFLWRSTCSGIWLDWSGRNSGPCWTGDNHFDPIEIRLPLRSISHPHLRNHTHTLQTQSTIDSRTDRRIRHNLGPQSLLAAPAAGCLSDLPPCSAAPLGAQASIGRITQRGVSCGPFSLSLLVVAGYILINWASNCRRQRSLRRQSGGKGVEADGDAVTSDVDDLAIEAPK